MSFVITPFITDVHPPPEPPSILDVKKLEYAELVRNCKIEIRDFQHNKNRESRCCFELWRRTFKEVDPNAWDFFDDVYRPEVYKWVACHPGIDKVDEEMKFFVNGAFRRLAQYMTADTFNECRNLAALLTYLGACVNAEVVDNLRKLAKQDAMNYLQKSNNEIGEQLLFEQIPDNQESPEDIVIYKEQEMIIWDEFCQNLTTEEEYIVAYASFRLGLKANSIYELYSDRFSDVNEVYRVKGNMLRRVRRNHMKKM